MALKGKASVLFSERVTELYPAAGQVARIPRHAFTDLSK
jgi:hypothetical protein